MLNEIQYILYNPPDETGKVQVIIRDETICCAQKAMAQLLGVGVLAISKHLKYIFEEGDLDENVVVSFLEVTTQHGAIEGKIQQKETKFSSLDAIISVFQTKNEYLVAEAKAKAESEYDIFNKPQRIDSDFDKTYPGKVGRVKKIKTLKLSEI